MGENSGKENKNLIQDCGLNRKKASEKLWFVNQ